MGQDLELVGPAQGVIHVDVDLGQDVVKYQVLELLLVADVMVDGARTTPRRAARLRMVRAWTPSFAMTVSASATTRSRVSRGTTVLIVDGRVKPQRARPVVGRSCAGCGRCSRVGSRPLPLVHAASLNVGLDR